MNGQESSSEQLSELKTGGWRAHYVLIVISASYPKEKRGWAMGIFHIAIPLGAAAGVILGGITSVKWGWRFLRSTCWEARGGLILSAPFPTRWAEAPTV